MLGNKLKNISSQISKWQNVKYYVSNYTKTSDKKKKIIDVPTFCCTCRPITKNIRRMVVV